MVPEEAEAVQFATAATLILALLAVQEQHLIKEGSYVRLHGLKSAQYNGKEGMVIAKEGAKVKVKLAQDTKDATVVVVRVYYWNLTLMPTYSTYRCKLNKHQTVEVTCHREPVATWPPRLTGTYYDFLDVRTTATTEEIKAAYKRLSVLLHPDKNPAYAEKATRLFKQVSEAHDCLKDDHKRRCYDQEIGVNQHRRFHPWPTGPPPQTNSRRPMRPWF